MSEHIVIERRFRGPPESGNGGYTCGRVAQCIEGDARVRLHIPPPLETQLTVQETADGIAVLAGATTVATASKHRLALDVPVLPDMQAIRAGSSRFRGFENHFFPSCFVCGTGRDEDGGLCIYAGAIEDTELVGAVWEPAADLTAADGLIAEEFIWSALDCPGGYAFDARPGHFILLGEFQVQIDQRPRAGEVLPLLAWERESDGRKHHVGTALYNTAGDCLARGLATWIEVKGEPFT